MRRISRVLVLGLFSLVAGSARAGLINPNPVSEVRGASAPGGSLSADVTALSIVGNTATFQLSVVTGSVTGVDLGMLLNSLSAPTTYDFVSGASFAGSTGTGGTASVGGGGTQAQFDFTTPVLAGQSSKQLVVTFVSAVPTGYFGSVNFDNGFVTTKSYQVPEPAALALLGLWLGGLSGLRRRAESP
ncbi:MAG TPA: PEP-CTERM sorting domain-containing protein [Myxococcota bacterium]|nr:PEP-CTERM sorting domain-containing protein [Myxococcota bacterium]